jgi:hypothetical protein
METDRVTIVLLAMLANNAARLCARVEVPIPAWLSRGETPSPGFAFLAFTGDANRHASSSAKLTTCAGLSPGDFLEIMFSLFGQQESFF